MQLDGLPDAEEPPIWKECHPHRQTNSTELKRRLGIILSAWTSPKRLLSRGGKTAVLRAKGFFKPSIDFFFEEKVIEQVNLRSGIPDDEFQNLDRLL